jgi:hypothetical protein
VSLGQLLAIDSKASSPTNPMYLGLNTQAMRRCLRFGQEMDRALTRAHQICHCKPKKEERKTNGPVVCICCMNMPLQYILYITILNIIYIYIYIILQFLIYYIYTSLYELIHELSRVEPSLLRLLFEPGIGVHEALHLIFESSSSRAYASRARACSRSASLI